MRILEILCSNHSHLFLSIYHVYLCVIFKLKEFYNYRIIAVPINIFIASRGMQDCSKILIGHVIVVFINSEDR